MKKTKDSRTNNHLEDAQVFVASQYGASVSQNQANATDEAIKGMGFLRSMAARLKNVGVEKKQGNLFEIIETTKFNIDAASKAQNQVRASVTALEGDPHAAADILIRKNNQVVDQVQAKSSQKVAHVARMFRDEKYNNMQKLTNVEHAEPVRKITDARSQMNSLYRDEHADTAKNVTGQLKYGDIQSGGTSYKETVFATKYPKIYTHTLEMKQIGNEMFQTGSQAAMVGASFGGAISLLTNSIAVLNGSKDMSEASRQVIGDAAKSGARAFSVGATGVGIRASAAKIGLPALAKSNVATAIAAATIETGISVFRYVKGEIDHKQLGEQLGHVGVSSTSGFLAGMAVGSVLGPVGTVIGGAAGYILSSNVYQSTVAIMKGAKLAEEESTRLVALYNESISQMKAQRELFEYAIKQKLEYNEREMKKCFRKMDMGLKNGRFGDTIVALESFNNIFGKSLKLSNFQDFDRHMRSNKPLEL